MGDRIWQFSLLFFGLLAMQVLLFDNIELFGFLTAYVYILFILLLPVDISPMVALPLAFTQGLVVDLFSSSLGLHATANTVLAFLRPYLLHRYLEKDNSKISVLPSIKTLGKSRMAQYVLIGVSIHHITLYLLAAATFNGMGYMLLRMLCNILFTGILLIIALAIVTSPSNRRQRI